MSKRCSECGESFPDSARYCDQDGAALRPSGLPGERPESRSRRAWLACLAVLCVAFLPLLTKYYVSLKVNVVLESVHLQRAAGTDGSSRSQGLLEQLFGQLESRRKREGVDLALRLRARNNSPFQIALASAHYIVQLGEHELSSGVWMPEGSPQVFAPGEELPIDVVVHPEASDAFDIGSEIQSGAPPSVRVHGQLAVEVMGITFMWPFEVQSVRIELDPRPEGGRKPSLAPLSESDQGPQLSV